MSDDTLIGKPTDGIAQPGRKTSETIAGSKPKETSLALAVSLSLSTWVFQFVIVWRENFGLETLPRIAATVDHPMALAELVAEAAGASIALPLIHVAIASIFKSKRNRNTRRRIFIGWSAFILLIGVASLLAKNGGA